MTKNSINDERLKLALALIVLRNKAPFEKNKTTLNRILSRLKVAAIKRSEKQRSLDGIYETFAHLANVKNETQSQDDDRRSKNIGRNRYDGILLMFSLNSIVKKLLDNLQNTDSIEKGASIMNVSMDYATNENKVRNEERSLANDKDSDGYSVDKPEAVDLFRREITDKNLENILKEYSIKARNIWLNNIIIPDHIQNMQTMPHTKKEQEIYSKLSERYIIETFLPEIISVFQNRNLIYQPDVISITTASQTKDAEKDLMPNTKKMLTIITKKKYEKEYIKIYKTNTKEESFKTSKNLTTYFKNMIMLLMYIIKNPSSDEEGAFSLEFLSQTAEQTELQPSLSISWTIFAILSGLSVVVLPTFNFINLENIETALRDSNFWLIDNILVSSFKRNGLKEDKIAIELNRTENQNNCYQKKAETFRLFDIARDECANFDRTSEGLNAILSSRSFSVSISNIFYIVHIFLDILKEICDFGSFILKLISCFEENTIPYIFQLSHTTLEAKKDSDEIELAVLEKYYYLHLKNYLSFIYEILYKRSICLAYSLGLIISKNNLDTKNKFMDLQSLKFFTQELVDLSRGCDLQATADLPRDFRQNFEFAKRYNKELHKFCVMVIVTEVSARIEKDYGVYTKLFFESNFNFF